MDIRLYLNQELQFSSLDERYYHEALVFPAMELAASPKRVLVLGGGDGLAVREILKYPNVEHVDLVDIDPKMVQLAKTHPALLVQNERSFLDEKVTVHIEDAKGYISGQLEPYDVIIIDFPDPSDSIISSLYTKELFSKVALLLAEDGVLVCQSNSPEEAPRLFWSIGKTIEAAGFYTRGYKILVPSFGVWGFHLATKKELSEEIPEISVPHEALPKNMTHLFNFSPTILSERQHAIVNEVSNLRLHKVYEEEIQK
ncbi:spermidine synthase [Peribacillus asahii]|nr:spermidine synthase [Peribacillus asahii]